MCVCACVCVCVFYIVVLERYQPLLEVSIDDSAGEAFSADPNTLQHTVTPQLVDNQVVLHQTWKERRRVN